MKNKNIYSESLDSLNKRDVPCPVNIPHLILPRPLCGVLKHTKDLL